MNNKETFEEVRKVERTELFNSIFSVVKQIPRKDVDGDAMDAPSCAYEIEQLFYKWQQEQESKYSVRYMKSEQDFQIERMSKLGINITGQCFEQMVTSLIQLAERRYSDEDMLKSFLAGVDKESYNGKNFEEWFEQFKNK